MNSTKPHGSPMRSSKMRMAGITTTQKKNRHTNRPLDKHGLTPSRHVQGGHIKPRLPASECQWSLVQYELFTSCTLVGQRHRPHRETDSAGRAGFCASRLELCQKDGTNYHR